MLSYVQRTMLPSYQMYDLSQKTLTLRVTLKHLSLMVLVVQTSAMVLMLRYSRTHTLPDQPMYTASTAVFFAECIKCIACIGMIWWQEGSWQGCLYTLQHEILYRPRSMLLLAVPSAIYAIQNNLLYIALSNLNAATFQIIYQLKILTTAIFSVILLGRRLDVRQWLALGLLAVGVMLVQLQPEKTTTIAAQVHSGTPLVGFLAVVIACVLSGFAGCYFERVLKQSSASVWIRNTQLGISGILFALIAMLFQDYDRIMEHGLLYGYTGFTWAVVLNQALGGLLVAMVVKYADNILKGFATSISIILSGILSFFFFEFQPNIWFLVGAAIVLGASFMYGQKPSLKSTLLAIHTKDITTFHHSSK
jgi:UDP-sugar transporter A1/2/3